MTVTPAPDWFRSAYSQRLTHDGLTRDEQQLRVVDELQALGTRLIARQSPSWFERFRPKPPAARGVYIWGGVGRGKTWLMDLFFEQIPLDAKGRLHFHRFMQQVHAELAITRGKNPLHRVAARFARQWQLLCLDEFNVVDIGDAVILAGLLQALFQHGIVLVSTSNVPPDSLYRDGIQRASFLPAIALLQQHTQVLNLAGERDYRQEVLQQARVYHHPLTAETDVILQREFLRLTGEGHDERGELVVNNRTMPYRMAAKGIVWFDFEALCGPPRSQLDYIELARCQNTVFISDIPVMGAARDDRTRRFIFLIDEFYDRRVKVVLSAAAPPSGLYMGERLAFEFQRTVSRLTEMQTAAYLGREHRA